MPVGITRAKHRLDGVLPAWRPLGIAPLAAVAVGLLVIVLGISSGTTFALWVGTAPVNASTVATGNSGITVNGQTSYVVSALDPSRLGPGTSVAAPVTVANSGSVPLSAFVSQGVVNSQTNLMANELTLRVVSVANSAACITSVTGGVSGRIPGFTSATTPISLATGGSQVVCLVLTLDLDAPATVQGGTTSFTLTLTGTQVAP